MYHLFCLAETIVFIMQGQIYAGSLFIAVVFNWDLYAAIIFILIITMVYTLIGKCKDLLGPGHI